MKNRLFPAIHADFAIKSRKIPEITGHLGTIEEFREKEEESVFAIKPQDCKSRSLHLNKTKNAKHHKNAAPSG